MNRADISRAVRGIVRFVTDAEARERREYLERRIMDIRAEVERMDENAARDAERDRERQEFFDRRGPDRPFAEVGDIRRSLAEPEPFIRRGSYARHECEFPELHDDRVGEAMSR